MADDTAAKPGYAFNIIYDMGLGLQFQITGSLPIGATKEQIDAEFEKFRPALEKQRTRSVIPGLKEGIATTRRTLAGYRQQLTRLDEANEGKPIPTNQRSAREQLVQSLEVDAATLAHKETLLAECLKEVE